MVDRGDTGRNIGEEGVGKYRVNTKGDKHKLIR